MKTSAELTKESKTRSGRMINFLVTFNNPDRLGRRYQLKADNDTQIDEYIEAIYRENEDVNYIRY